MEFSNSHSPLPTQEGSSILNIPHTLRTVKLEPMNDWHTDLSPYTPNAIDCFGRGGEPLENFGCPGSTTTYMDLTPAEIEPSMPYLFTSDLLNYDYKPTFYKMDQNEILLSDIKDEGLGSSPASSIHSLTPPTEEVRRFSSRDSANESVSSNEYTGVQDSEDVSPLLSPYRLSEPLQRSEPPRTQCVKCGCLVLIGECWRECSGHYLCYTCRAQEPLVGASSVIKPEDHSPKKSKKKSLAIVPARHQVCNNCKCTNTTLWRRGHNGEPVCNACGLYEKLHKKSRPITMRKDTIQTRKRKPRNAESKKKTAPASTTVNNRGGIPVPVTIPPPPPYECYTTVEDTGSVRLLSSLGTNVPYFGNYHSNVAFHPYSGDLIN